MSDAAIQILGVSKTYPGAGRPAVSDINLTVPGGARLGFIGANGSGKTTLLRLMMNFVLPDQGTVSIMGQPAAAAAGRVIGFVPERQEGLENFTPRELLSLSGLMHGMTRERIRQRSAVLLDFAGLAREQNDLLCDFSKGMVQRVQICVALMHEPAILLLDEPTSGLDPRGQKDVLQLLQRLEGQTVIYAGHQLEEIESYCTSVAVLHEGRIIQELNLDDLAKEVYTLDLDRQGVDLVLAQADLQGELISENGPTVRLRVRGESARLQKLMSALDDQNFPVHRLRSRGVLEDLYFQYVASVHKSGEE